MHILKTLAAVAALSSFAFAKSGDFGIRLGSTSIHATGSIVTSVFVGELGATYQLDDVRLGLAYLSTSHPGFEIGNVSTAASSGSGFGASADYMFLDKRIDKHWSYYALAGADVKLANIGALNLTVVSLQANAGVQYALDKSIGLFGEFGLRVPVINQISFKSNLFSVDDTFSSAPAIELHIGATFR